MIGVSSLNGLYTSLKSNVIEIGSLDFPDHRKSSTACQLLKFSGFIQNDFKPEHSSVSHLHISHDHKLKEPFTSEKHSAYRDYSQGGSSWLPSIKKSNAPASQIYLGGDSIKKERSSHSLFFEDPQKNKHLVKDIQYKSTFRTFNIVTNLEKTEHLKKNVASFDSYNPISLKGRISRDYSELPRRFDKTRVDIVSKRILNY